jgi:uncharacterized protein (DUF1919 family)
MAILILNGAFEGIDTRFASWKIEKRHKVSERLCAFYALPFENKAVFLPKKYKKLWNSIRKVLR